MATRSLSFVSCIALTGLAGLLTTATGALAGGDCCAAGKAKVVAAAGEKSECSAEGKAVMVAAAGEKSECSAVGKAEMVAAAGAEGDCAANSECAADGAKVVAVGDSTECPACNAVHAAFAPVNAECPGSGEAVTEGITAQFAGFTVGFCCENCQDSFKKASDEKKTATVAKMVAVVNTECPGSGQAVDAEQVALYNGFAVGFCCEDCKAKFTKADDSKKSAVIAKSVKAVNTECPGSGMAVSGETFAAYNGVLVSFCCDDCQAEFAKADDAKRHKMTAKLVAASAGGCTDECKAMAAKAEAKS